MRRRRVREIVSELVDPRVEDPFDGSAERAALRDALARLTPEHRTVVVLRYYADLSVEQIADRIGEREGTVKSRLHYGLAELRAAYDAADRTPPGSVR
jgi:RNA polymerase sigma-70 factor (ECF subfamily)